MMFGVEIHAHYRVASQADAETLMQELQDLLRKYEAVVSEPECRQR